MSSESAVQEESTVEKVSPAPSGNVVIFELEFTAFHGRSLLSSLLEKQLKKAGVDFSPALVSRFGLNTNPSHVANSIVNSLDDGAIQADALAEELTEAFHRGVQMGEIERNPLFDQFFRECNSFGNLQLVACTGLPEDLARNLLERNGYDVTVVKIFSHADCDRHFPRIDTWIKIAKSLKQSISQCAALVSSQESSRTALAAGMRCIAIPDSFTSFQDFSGADAIVEADEDSLWQDAIRNIL